ncbi:MAG TPA: hypothetical protein VKJ47_10880 [Candidatus Binatia bacterium]|nr:hypothetical protein [Candidatus Binatia bacterium]
MKSGKGNLIRSLPLRLRALTKKWLALLSALRTSSGRRPRKEHLCRPEVGGFTFAGAQTFRDLFQQLDAKRVLWGSQKRYGAKELKILINRVRAKNPNLHLPLEVIPETGGLRERVKELAAAEVSASERDERRRAA